MHQSPARPHHRRFPDAGRTPSPTRSALERPEAEVGFEHARGRAAMGRLHRGTAGASRRRRRAPEDTGRRAAARPAFDWSGVADDLFGRSCWSRTSWRGSGSTTARCHSGPPRSGVPPVSKTSPAANRPSATRACSTRVAEHRSAASAIGLSAPRRLAAGRRYSRRQIATSAILGLAGGSVIRRRAHETEGHVGTRLIDRQACRRRCRIRRTDDRRPCDPKWCRCPCCP